MYRLFIYACLAAVMASSAGCGNKGSSTSSTKPVFSNSTTFNSTGYTTVSGDLLGGSIQKGAFSAKVSGFQNISTPRFRNVSTAFSGLTGIATDGTSHYAVNNVANTIVKVAADGTVSLFAGGGFSNFTSAVTLRSASFNGPSAITTDNNKTGTTFYVADSGYHAIRKISPAGTVTRLAGDGTTGSEDTSLGVVARFNSPTGITIVGPNVYVADYNNHTIRMIETATGRVTTLAGYPNTAGNADGDRTEARFSYPARIASDGRHLYVTDSGNATIRRISLATGRVETIAGTAGIQGTTDGPVGTSLFRRPNGITSDGVYLYVTDYPYIGDSNQRLGTVRRIELSSGTYVTTTLQAGFETPVGIATDGNGLFITERSNDTIVRIK